MTSNGTIPDSLNTSYSSYSASRSLPFGPHPALLVIDVCEAYLTPGSPLYADRFDSALRSCERLIAACRSAAVPVIFTRVVYDTPEAGGNWYKYKLPKPLSCFDASNPLSKFPEPVQPAKEDLVISKQFSSSFFGTPLATQLKEIDTLIICGFSTSGCVRATTVDAMQYGLFPWVVKDACGDRHEYPHEANLFDIQAKFGEVVSEAEIVELLAGRQVAGKTSV